MVKKPIVDLTKDEFKINMKAFRRWAKENGCYLFIRNYLDKDSDIFEELHRKPGSYIGYFFGDALGLFCFIKKKYDEYGHEYWWNMIEPIHTKWKNFYSHNNDDDI